MTDLIEQYLDYFRCRAAATTAKRVKYQLYQFMWYLFSLGIFSFSRLESRHVFQWLKLLKEKGCSTMYSYQLVGVVRKYCEWLKEEGYLLVNPIPANLEVRNSEYLPRPFPEPANAVKFLNRIREIGRFPLRNRAILELCYSAGLRRAEMHGLNVTDVRGDWLKVTGKGNKERMVPVGSKAKTWLNMYIRSERKHLSQKYNPLEDALFLNQYGNRLGMQSYSYLVTNNRAKGENWTFHSFRHACASHMLANGASIRVIQKLLGHGKLSSTQVYTRVEVCSLREVLKKYHPRG